MPALSPAGAVFVPPLPWQQRRLNLLFAL